MGTMRWVRGAPLWFGAALLLSAAWVIESPSRSAPESHEPFTDRRVVSPSGRYYAVLRSRKGVWPGPFELVRRRDGVRPIEPAVAEERVVEDGRGESRWEKVGVARDLEDQLLAEGTLPQLPAAAKVCDEPLGIVLFDRHADRGYGQILAFLDGEGRIAWSRDLDGLFGGEPPGTIHTYADRIWSAAWGVDGELGVAWVLSRGGEFRAVSLETGEVSTPGLAWIARLCARGEDAVRIAAMDAVLACSDLDLAPFPPALAPIAVDDQQPLAVRLRAAVLCHRAGVRVDHDGWFLAMTRAEDLESAIFAAQHLPEIAVDEDALSPLVAVLARLEQHFAVGKGFPLFYSRLPGFVAAFERHGVSGLTGLRQLIDAEDTSPRVLINASEIWWRLGQAGLPDRLRSLIRTGDERDANAALDALIYSQPEGLSDILLELATAGTADDVRLAIYFLKHPRRDAAGPMDRMLGEAGDDLFKRWMFRRARNACRY